MNSQEEDEVWQVIIGARVEVSLTVHLNEGVEGLPSNCFPTLPC